MSWVRWGAENTSAAAYLIMARFLRRQLLGHILVFNHIKVSREVYSLSQPFKKNIELQDSCFVSRCDNEKVVKTFFFFFKESSQLIRCVS